MSTTLVSDIRIVATRELRPLIREPFAMVISMIQPLVFLALFAPLLPDASEFGGNALQWFVPGIVTMSCLMGVSMTGAGLMEEMFTGSHERLLVSPLSRTSLLVGRTLKDVVPVFAQAAIILAIVTPFAFDLHPLTVLVGMLILAAFCFGIGALSLALALAAKDQQWLFWTVQQTVLFPILLLAGVLLPVDDGPRWLRVLSQINPMTHIVNAERALFAGSFPVDVVLGGAAAAVGVGVVGIWVGLRTMRNA